MNVGERGGPLLVDGRYVIFEVREKRRGPSIPGPDFEKARNELLNMKKRRALDQFLAGVAREKGVSVFADRVRELPVSPIPMMAFRILGFGGRMVEFPFVESLFQWAGEDRISDPVP